MRINYLVAFIFASVILITGCGPEKKQPLQYTIDYDEPVSVVIEGEGGFPESLAGRWRANKNGWEFVFEPDGTISSAVISLGRFNLVPGRVNKFLMKTGKESVIVPDQWSVLYNADTRDISIIMPYKYVHVEVGGGYFEGTLEDIITGQFSPEYNYLEAEWNAYPKYTMTTDKYKDFVLESDPNRAFQGTLSFIKLRDEPDPNSN